MKAKDRPDGPDYPEVLQEDAVLICSISGLQLTAKSSKNNKLEIQHDNNSIQSHLSKVSFQPKASSRQRETDKERC